jgi:nucleoside-diphosphate-sugar epimerase
MKILVTGAGGFIGANLVRRFMKENHEVHAFINNESHRLKSISKEINLYNVDIRNKDDVEHYINTIKPQAIAHCATYGAYPDSQGDIQKMYDVNLKGTMNLVNAWDGYEVFINTSSSSIYGNQTRPMKESMVPAPKDHYGASKMAGELYCHVESRRTGAPIINTRLFSVYGPYEEPNRLIISTIQKCLAGEKLKFTQGKQKRDFIHIQDVEDAYLKLIEHPELGGEVFNIGTGEQWSVRQAVQKIMKATRYQDQWPAGDYPDFGAIETRSDETFNWVANPNKTWKRLGWKAEIGFDEGIRKTVDWVKQNTRVME